ncbi:MAG: AMIN domain-containing protein, partial [Halieaceae bacterium]|nr:AMIN domain-containing protein [Halieaceae bacterium]
MRRTAPSLRRVLRSLMTVSVLVLSWALFGVPRPASAEAIVVTDIRVGQHGDVTRFVLDFTQKIEFTLFTLAEPDRLVIDLPEVGKVNSGLEMTAFWIGPDQWMIMASHDTHEDLAHMLRTGFGSSASVTEQTDGWARFDVEGENTVAMFERLCPLDAKAM